MRLIVSILLLSIASGFVQAQTTPAVAAANPFEITSRLPKITLANGTEVIVRNPFDVLPHRAPGADKTLLDNTVTSDDSGKPLLSFSKGNTLPRAFIFWILILTTAFFTFSVAANRGILIKAWRSFLNDNAMNVAQREAAGFVGSTPYFLMYGSFLLNAGLFIFLIVQAFTPIGTFYNWMFFLFCMGLAWVIFLSKHLMLSVLRWLIPSVDNEINRYNFLIIIFNCVLGFFLLPFNFLIAFAESGEQKTFMALWILALSAIFYGYRTLRALSVGTKILAAHQFHFLLYLCAAEIAPVLVLVKLFI